MGGGTWSARTYSTVTTSKIDSGTTFAYTADAKSSGRYVAHDDLKILDENMQPVTRESRDSDEHPESTPIVIGFDVTGSMGGNPAILQRELKGLFGMLVRKDVVSDPQVAIGAYGDTVWDRVPVQLSQFESDNRIDDNLDNVFVEGGGGGNMGEMSTALVWFVANHVITDSYIKRRKRGYLFLIGDECPLKVSVNEARKYLGTSLQEPITPESAFEQAKERWDVYFLLVDNNAARYQGSYERYVGLLGKDHVIPLQTTDSAPAVIASVIGIAEGTADADSLSTDLVESGFSDETALDAIRSVTGVTGAVEKADTGYADLGL